jgi:hypothetical protein
VKAVSRLTVGTGRQAAEAAFDELKVYKRPLSNGEIYDAYRALMPVDLILDRAVIAPDCDEEVVVVAAPGGHFMRPMPAERPLSTGRVCIRVQIADAADRVVAEKAFVKNLAAPAELRVPVHNLPAGDYRVRCAVARAPRSLLGWTGLIGRPPAAEAVQRSFELKAYRPLPAMPPSDDDIRLGGVVFEKDIRDGKVLESGGANLVASSLGSYLEGGARKMSRFAFEVQFPERFQHGRPVMLEVEWPDDKPRSMGLYLYPQSKSAQHRDRLGGGVQSGVEYPLTGRMQRTRYLFYPGLTNYLFEARAMVDGYPAALSAFRVYEVQNDRLPKLAVRRPDGLPPRRFGYQDEDETFDQNLGWDYPDKSAQTVTERLLDYLDYTGQNAWQYPFLRYNGYNFPMEGAAHSLYPYSADAFRYMTEALGRRGVATIAGINLYTLPELYFLPDQIGEAVRKGWVLTTFRDPPLRPGGQPRPNHANPEVRAMIARHVRETAQRYGTLPGVEGISVSTHHVGFFTSLDEGYDDYTIGRFSREAGVAVPAESAAGRREFLARLPQADAWLSWRARQSVELFRDIRSEMDKVSPRLSLYVVSEIPDGPSPESPALLGQLQAIRGVYLVQWRNSTYSRHRQHWGSPATNYNDRAYDPAVAARFMNGRLGFADNAPTYFESFKDSLKNDVYAGFFQNADVKPFGRYFLKDLAFAVAAMDAQRYLIGAQPLGSWGRDAETREFAKAYCALPALPFETAPGARDPVTVRYLNTDQGTYVYAVSMLWDDCEAALACSSAQPLQDLSTGGRIADGKVALRAFELRSFWSPDPRLRVAGVEAVVPARVPEFCAAQLGQAQRAVDLLAERKAGCDEARAALAQARERLRDGRYAELHRLLFSLPVRDAVNRAAAPLER